MITVEQALDKILSYATALEEEERPILDSLGQEALYQHHFQQYL